jgi:hypothetical protein
MEYWSWINDGALAAWVQAVGSILAIVASIYVVDRGHRLESLTERQRKAEELEFRVKRMHELIVHAESDFRALRANPDKPNALAMHWRDKLHNSIGLTLAQIDFDLDQLRSIPWMEVANVRNLFDLNYALLVAKSALEQEDRNVPVTDEVIRRISNAVSQPSVAASAGIAVLRSHAMSEMSGLP